jgi:hypothetical protein
MFRNYFVTAFRNMRRNAGYTFLNVMGLTLSVAACLVIFLITRNELSYDRYHRKSDRIYRVTMNALDFNPSVSMAVTPALRNDFPELEHVSQVWYQRGGLVQVGEERYLENSFAYADGEFTAIFDQEWLAGSPAKALAEPNAVVLTASAAKKYFGDKDPMGRVLRLGNEFNLTVTGLIKDQPGNTHLPYNFLVSWKTVEPKMKHAMEAFYNISGGSTYVLLPEHYDVSRISGRMPAFITRHWGADIAAEAKLLFQPLADIHFDQRYIAGSPTPTTSRSTYYALAAVALFIIITACINFINLATAQAMKRAREVGVRKALGANRLQLVRQFLGETSFLVVGAIVMGLLLALMFLPQTASVLGIQIGNHELLQPSILGLLAALAVIIILAAGLYPAFVQSSFKPVESLKSNTGMQFRGLTLRKSLVFVQFAISQVLIIGTLVVAKQMDFFKNQDLGFNKEAVVTFSIPDDTKREVLLQQLKANPGVKEISLSSGAPSYNASYMSFSAPHLGIEKDDVTELKYIDAAFLRMFDIQLLAGRQLIKTPKGDTVYNVLVNESLIRKLGITQPQAAIGVRFRSGTAQALIQGVVKDFQSESKHKQRRPCVLVYDEENFFRAAVRLQGDTRPTLARIEQEWSALFPASLFRYEFIDEHIAAMYRQEEKVYAAFRFFSILAIVIGCLGLYGLVTFAAMQRTKEVGIRKVLGASPFHILTLFGREFFMLIALAFLAAAPLGWFIMHRWLDNFAYQTSMGAGVFISAIAASAIIAALTIAYQSLKAALSNPLKSLKTD